MVAVNKTVVYCSEQKNVTHARRHTFHETAALTLRCFQKDAESDVTHGGGARPLAVCVACARERSSLSSFRAQARRCAKKKKTRPMCVRYPVSMNFVGVAASQYF